MTRPAIVPTNLHNAPCGSLRRALLGGLVALLWTGCATEAAQRAAADEVTFPAWVDLGGRELALAPELEEAAALLCVRGGGTVDDEVRQLAGLSAGQVTVAVELGGDRAALRRALLEKAGPLLDELRATHAGFAEGSGLEGERCVAAVGARQVASVSTPLPAKIAEGGAFPVELVRRGRPQARSAALYLQDPHGFVRKASIAVDDNGTLTEVVAPDRGPGRYVVQILIEEQEGDPEVAILWPFLVGAPPQGQPLPPYPQVLFPDEGHGDLALTHRAEALVQRLRTQQEIPVLKVAPPLMDVAAERARAISDAAGLGHRLPQGKTPVDDVVARAPRFGFSRLAEVQAQAGTLQDAWRALLRSPAHRFELVHPTITHFGTAVRRGEDGAGRPLISVVVLFAKRVDRAQLDELRTELVGKINLARHHQGLPTLAAHARLVEVCDEQAAAMAQQGDLDERILGSLVTERALEKTELDEARVQLAAVDDPRRLPMARVALAPAMRHVGIGLHPDARGGQWMVCVLVAGEGGPEPGGDRTP